MAALAGSGIFRALDPYGNPRGYAVHVCASQRTERSLGNLLRGELRHLLLSGQPEAGTGKLRQQVGPAARCCGQLRDGLAVLRRRATGQRGVPASNTGNAGEYQTVPLALLIGDSLIRHSVIVGSRPDTLTLQE